MQKSRPLKKLFIGTTCVLLSAGSIYAQGNTNVPVTPVVTPVTPVTTPVVPVSPTNTNTPVTPVNQGLQFTSSPLTSAIVNQNYYYQLSASGSSNSTYTFSSQNIPGWLKINPGGAAGAVKINSTSVPSPIRAAVDAQGNIFVASTANKNIYKITPDGTTTVWLTLPLPVNSYPWFSGALIVGNYYYIADQNNNTSGITRYDMTQSNPTPEIVHPSNGFTNLTYHNGYLYAGNTNKNKIIRVNLATLVAEDVLTSIEGVTGLDFLANGDMLIVSSYDKKILKYSNQNLSTVISGLSTEPSDVKVAQDGSIYVAQPGYAIKRYNADYSGGTAIHQGNTYIYNISISPNGKIIFANATSGNEGVFGVAGMAALYGKPGASDIGSYPVTLTVSDGVTSKDQNFTINATDPNPPVMVSTTPASGAVDVALDTKIKIIFDEHVLAGTGKIIVAKYPYTTQTEIDVTGNQVSIEDSALTVTLPADLDPSSSYYVMLPYGGVKDQSGNGYGQINSNNNSNSSSGGLSNSDNTVSVSAGSSWTFTTVAKIKADQTITFAAKDTVVYGIGQHELNALASSELPVSYSVSNESVASLSSSGTLTIKRAGQVEITASQAGNGDYKPATSVTQILTVSKKNVTVKIISDVDIRKFYDGNKSIDPGNGALYIDGAVENDYVSVNAKYEFDNKNAGENKTVTASEFEIHGEDADNYHFTNTLATAKGVIDHRKIKAFVREQVTAVKPYDGKTTIPMPAENFELDGVLDNEQVSVTATGNYEDKNAAPDKSVLITGFELQGADKANYELTTQSREASGAILPVQLMVTADNKSKKEGVANPVLTLSYTGLVNGEQATDLESTPAVQTTATLKSPIGYYEITVDGARSSNYIISYTKGKLTVTPAASRIKAWSDQSTLNVRVYSDVQQKAAITLYTETGQPIVVQQKQLQPGVNSFAFPIIPLTRGFYVVNVNADKFMEGQRVKIK